MVRAKSVDARHLVETIAEPVRRSFLLPFGRAVRRPLLLDGAWRRGSDHAMVRIFYILALGAVGSGCPLMLAAVTLCLAKARCLIDKGSQFLFGQAGKIKGRCHGSLLGWVEHRVNA